METFSPEDSLEKITNSLGASFSGLLDRTFKERLEDPSNSDLTPEQVKEVIDRYARINQTVAASAAVLPGPLGIFSAVGELVLVTGNQLKMIYDLGCANNKEHFLNKDLLIDIPLQAFGVSSDLDQLQHQLVNLEESPTAVIQTKATEYARVIAVKNLKKSFMKFVPVAGPLLMSVWTKKSTLKIARVAGDFLSNDAILPALDKKYAFTEDEPVEVMIERLKILVTLMEQNGTIKEEELSFVEPMIQAVPIPMGEKDKLLAEARRMGSHFNIDTKVILDFPDVIDDLITDMVVLMKRDGVIEPNEKIYFEEIAQQLNVPPDEVKEYLIK